MIYSLRGKVLLIDGDTVVIDVRDVGFKMIWNIEAIPGEGMAPKLAMVNKIIFADSEGNYIVD